MSTPREEVLSKNLRTIISSLIVGVVSGVGFVILMMLEMFAEVGAILLLSGFVALITCLVCLGRRTRLKRIYCDLCGKKYNYEEEVEWEVKSYVTKSTGTNTAKKEANIKVQCTCGNCGKTQTFYKTVTIASVDSRGDIRENGADDDIKFYFR